MSELKKILAVKDNNYHWYIIPIELKNDFNKDLNNEELVDSGEFDKKYSKYMTGGDVNLIQLYACI